MSSGQFIMQLWSRFSSDNAEECCLNRSEILRIWSNSQTFSGICQNIWCYYWLIVFSISILPKYVLGINTLYSKVTFWWFFCVKDIQKKWNSLQGKLVKYSLQVWFSLRTQIWTLEICPMSPAQDVHVCMNEYTAPQRCSI